MPDLMDSDGVHQIFDTYLNRSCQIVGGNLTGSWAVVKTLFKVCQIVMSDRQICYKIIVVNYYISECYP